MNIGKNILYYRKQKQISQEQLAEQIGVTRQTISNWELEESCPDVNQLRKLAETFKVSLDDLANNNIETTNDNAVIIMNNEITIVSKIENVVVKCSKVQSSQQFKGGKTSPKYALFAVADKSKIFPNNTFLGWYENKEEISKEIEEIVSAMSTKDSIYELKYNVEVDKKMLGMSLKIKK